MSWWYFAPVAVICVGGLVLLRLREAQRFLDSLNKVEWSE